jgi:hypothetical protein
MVISDQTNKSHESNQNCNREEDKLQQIKQIECEQRLIIERMIRVEFEKKRLESLLNMLRSLDSDDEKQNA